MEFNAGDKVRIKVNSSLDGHTFVKGNIGIFDRKSAHVTNYSVISLNGESFYLKEGEFELAEQNDKESAYALARKLNPELLPEDLIALAEWLMK